MSSVVVVAAEDNPLGSKDIQALKLISKSPSNSITVIYVIPKLPAEMFQIPAMKKIEAVEYHAGHEEIQKILSELGLSKAHSEIIEGKPAANGRVEDLKPDVILTSDPDKFRDFIAKIRHATIGDKIPTMDPVSYEKELQTQHKSSYGEITKRGGKATLQEEMTDHLKEKVEPHKKDIKSVKEAEVTKKTTGKDIEPEEQEERPSKRFRS